MSPKLNHENLGSVQKTAYLTATITTVDSEFDTACFGESGKCPAGTDIPIFYHCQYEEGEEPAQRDNGALEGAAGAFNEDDEVIVQCEVLDSTTYKPLYVIGFVDKPKQCGFRFKLRREDVPFDPENPDAQTLLTDAYDMRHSLSDSNGNWIWTDWEYNDKTEYWDLTFHEPNHRSGSAADPSPNLDPNGYWIWYWSNITATYVLNTQYPYKYKTADQQKTADLIKPGTYDGLLPYLKRIYDYDPALQPEEYPPDICVFLSGEPATYASDRGMFKTEVKRRVLIVSSVPYRITYALRKEDDKNIEYYHVVDGACTSHRSAFINTTSKNDSITASGDSLNDTVWYPLSFSEITYWVKTKGTSAGFGYFNYEYQIMSIFCGYE